MKFGVNILYSLKYSMVILTAAFLLPQWVQPVQAAENTKLSQLIEWQRIKLEEDLRTKLKESIAPALGDKPYLLSVTIDLLPIPEAKEATPNQKKVESAATPTPQVPKEIVPLGKLDIETPFPETKEESAEKADVKPEPPVINIFKYISKTKINLVLDNSVTDSKKDIIRRTIIGLTATFGQQAPDVSVEKAELVTAPPSPAPPPEEKPWGVKQWLIELKNLIIVFIAVVTLGVFALLIVSRNQRTENRKVAILEAQNAREEAAAQKIAEAQEKLAKGDEDLVEDKPKDVEEDVPSKGFERFETLLKAAPEQAGTLIRQWIRAPGQGAKEALALLPQVYSTEQLLAIFQQLNVEDRKEWKKLLGTKVDAAGRKKAELYISTQIVESLLVPNPEMDPELQKMLAEIKVTECVEITLQNPELGAVMASLLPTAQVSLMFALLSVDTANAVTLASLKISDQDLRLKSDALKAAVSSLKAKEKSGVVPFMDKAVDMLQEVSPEKELSIFNALAQAQEFKLLETAAKKFFPTELLLKLPEKLIKNALERLLLARRADFIYSNSEENRALLMDAFGKSGSKIRELIDAEMEQIKGDQVRQRRIEKNKEPLMRQFGEAVRRLINSSEAANELAEGVLNSWLSEKSGGQVGSAQQSTTAA